MVKPVLGRAPTNSQAGPNEGLCVEDSDIVEIALLEGAADTAHVCLNVIIVKGEATMNHQVGANQDRAMTLSWAGSWARAVRLGPGHDFKVENVDIIEEIVAVPSSEDEHLCASYQVGCVVEPRGWSTATLWALIPSHRYRVEGMQVSIDSTLRALATKDNDAGAR